MTTPKDEWLPIPIIGYSCYEWNESLGLVRSWKNNKWGRLQVPKVLRAQTLGGGYKAWHLTSDIDGGQHSISLHVLVCTHHHGQRPGKAFVCHNDGNVNNNSATNLRWDTPRANVVDSVKHGTRSSKLTDADAVSIITATGIGQKALAERFGVDRSMISLVRSGKRLSHVNKESVLSLQSATTASALLPTASGVPSTGPS